MKWEPYEDIADAVQNIIHLKGTIDGGNERRVRVVCPNLEAATDAMYSLKQSGFPFHYQWIRPTEFWVSDSPITGNLECSYQVLCTDGICAEYSHYENALRESKYLTRNGYKNVRIKYVETCEV